MLSNNKNIKKLNKNFRNKNKSTDILSFPFDKKKLISNKSYLGDIIISYEFINTSKSHSLEVFKRKLTKTFIHGFLHLLGYDHIRNNDYKEMLKEEELLLESVISKIN